MSGDYDGKTALVTGSARGIGRTIARRLAEEGARVIIADINVEAGLSTAEFLRQAGHDASFLLVDLSVSGAGAVMIDTAVKLVGSVDLLVNNARAGKRQSLLEETEENWDLAIDVGLKSAFFASQATIAHLRKTGHRGAIVNVASVAAVLATNESPSYHASKAGLLQLTRYLAVAAGPHGVRVNCVLPGLIIQDEHRARFDAADNEAFRKAASRYQPLGDVGSEADVAEAVVYLCSERARYVSGSCLVIDGGATVQEQFGLLLRQLD